jgi:predicted methyltransferase
LAESLLREFGKSRYPYKTVGVPGAEIDLRAAVNAISDVIQNRPAPLREFDQIYMKAGDMVFQAEQIARWSRGKRLAFIGDGDAISICVAYLTKREILPYGPEKITVFDFDERMCRSVERFADAERLDGLSSVLYNCLDPFPGPTNFDFFYTNPPWGASNQGESVKVFVERGMEATEFAGEGVVVIADDPELTWPKEVLANVQSFAIDKGFFVQRMLPQLHNYHLDDAPDLQSCNLFLAPVSPDRRPTESVSIVDAERLENFYGRDETPRARYVRELGRLGYGKAHDSEYKLDLLETPE